MSYSTSEYNRSSVARRSSFIDRPSPYKGYADKSKYLMTDKDNYQSKLLPKDKLEGYQSKYTAELPTRTRNILGGVDNYQSYMKQNYSKKTQHKELDIKPRSQMIENIDKIQNKIKGILGQS